MVERFLLAVLARARGSKWGILLTIFGVLLLFATLIIGLASVVGDALLVMDGVGPVINYLETGQGVLVGFVVSVVVILLGVAFLTRATPQPTQSVSVVQQTDVVQAETKRENERLNKEVEQRDKNIRALKQGYEELAAKLSDPTANRQREERMARERCTEVAVELTAFWQSHQRTDSQEFIAIFQKRQEWKVNDLRERLEKQDILTTRERDTLTFRSGDDLDKIEQIIFLLRKLGEGG